MEISTTYLWEPFKKRVWGIHMTLLISVIVALKVLSLMFLKRTHSNIIGWFYLIIFSLIMGGVGALIKYAFLPMFTEYSLDSSLAFNVFYYISLICGFISSFGIPYYLLVFAVFYCGVLSKREKYFIEYIAYVPVIITIVLYIQNSYSTVWVYSSMLMSYCFFGYFLLMYTYLTEKDSDIKKDRMLINILIVPTTLFIFIMKFLSLSLNFKGVYSIYFYIFPLAFIVFMFFAFKYGFMGAKFTTTAKDTFGNLFSGVELFNHSVKNEIVKISMTLDNIKASSTSLDADMNEQLQVIFNSAEHLMEMSEKIRHKEIILREEYINLPEEIDKYLLNWNTYLEKRNIDIEKNIPDIYLLCDKIHLLEVINNILKNAAEAIKEAGKINITAYVESKSFILAVSDDGCGIAEENLEKVIEPYFTTKGTKSNFGLGLQYCRNVIERHGGRLEIESTYGSGTTVFLCFPLNRTRNAELISLE